MLQREQQEYEWMYSERMYQLTHCNIANMSDQLRKLAALLGN
jgi:hypothetical protein